MSKVTFDYSGAHVLVTGGTSGIGAATAAAYRDAGADVTITGTRGSAGEYDADLSGYRYLPMNIEKGASIDAVAAALPRLDILINNAGILRDKSFSKMELADFELVLNVHLMGTVKPTKAVWEIMREQNYGRIVVTTSSSGLYGNFGQSNYGAAKLGIIGFMNTIKLEGQKNNIHINAISPVAATRMTENLMPAPVLEKLKPEYVTPGVVYLCSEEAPTGAILTAGAGAFALSRIYETEGVYLGEGGLSVEEVRDNWAKIADPEGQQAYNAGGEQSQKFFRKMSGG